MAGGGQTGGEFEGDPEQIKDYLQNLAKDGKISSQEYENILESMENRAAEP
jgi:hypothetical protein